MTIATEKIKPETTRWTLVRISGRRDTSTEWDALADDIFQMTWPLEEALPFELQENDDDLFTQVDNVTSASADRTWSFDESTRTLRLRTIGEVPNVDYLAMVNYYLFYCSSIAGDLSYYEDPDDLSSTVRNWNGRLMTDPQFVVAFQDIIAGVFSIKDSQFEFANIDSDFEQYLTAKDSFYKRDVAAWLFINGAMQKSYVGKSVSITLGDTVQLNVLDNFTRLDEAAEMGDGPGTTVKIPSTAAPEDIGKPIPLIVARESFHQRTDDSADYTGATDAGEWVDGVQARCTDYTPAQVYAIYNREWKLARTLNNLDTQSFGSLVRAVNPDAFSALFQFASYDALRIGDTMRWTNAGVPEYGRIVALGNFTHLGLAYNVRVLGVDTGFTPTANNSSVVVPLKCLSVWLEGAESVSATGYGLVYLYQGAQYTITETTLPTGNVSIRITLADNMESDIGIDMSEVVDPTRNRMKFALRTVGVTINHAPILKSILEQAGVVVNDASFTQAALDLVEDVKFMIPNLGETEFGPYRKYITDLLVGTLGYLSLNNDGEAVYKLLEAPVAGESRDSNLVLDQSDVQVTLDYQDIVTAITPINIHLPFTGTRQDVTRHQNSNAVVLHGIRNEIDLPHYMADQDPSRWADILALRSERRVLYTYETATEDLDSELGDDVTIESPRVVGGSGSQNVKITEIAKSADKVTVTASDLLGL